MYRVLEPAAREQAVGRLPYSKEGCPSPMAFWLGPQELRLPACSSDFNRRRSQIASPSRPFPSCPGLRLRTCWSFKTGTGDVLTLRG